MSKVEITIPPQFSEVIEKAAEKEGITADELTERAMKKWPIVNKVDRKKSKNSFKLNGR